jgi:hypothetical protein
VPRLASLASHAGPNERFRLAQLLEQWPVASTTKPGEGQELLAVAAVVVLAVILHKEQEQHQQIQSQQHQEHNRGSTTTTTTTRGRGRCVPGGCVDGTVHAGAAQHPAVGRIHNGLREARLSRLSA